MCPRRRKLQSKRRCTLNCHLTRKTLFQIILCQFASLEFWGLKKNKKIYKHSYILKVPKFSLHAISILPTYMINGSWCYSQISPWRSGHYLVWVDKSQYHHRRKKKVIIYLTCHCLPPQPCSHTQCLERTLDFFFLELLMAETNK